MLRKLFTLVVCLVATIVSTQAQTPPNNEIWYTTTDGNIAEYYMGDDGYEAGFEIVSNTYSNGLGVIRANKAIKSYGYYEERSEEVNFLIGFGWGFISDTLETIILPNSIKTISEDAFSGCSNLTSITIPEVVTQIGELAFRDCTSLQTFNSLLASEDGRCLIINGELVGFASSGLTSYTIPEEVTAIGGCVFYDCKELTSVTIPESVTSFGWYAFGGCSGLTSIDIPNSVESISGWTFYNCSGLTSISIPESISSIGITPFYGCCNIKHLEIGCYPYFALPESSTDDLKLLSMDIVNGLESVTLSNHEYEMYDYFCSLSNIKSITFSGAYASADGRCLITDGKLGLFSARGVAEYDFPESITEVGADALRDCDSLTSISIPHSVTKIEEEAFKGCAKLRHITVGCDPAIIPNDILSKIESVTIFNHELYDYFDKLPNIKSITFGGANASEDGRCMIIDGELVACNAKGLTEYTIPNDVTKIGVSALLNCDSLTSLTITNSATTFEPDTFNRCCNLTALNINCDILNDYWPNCQLTDVTIGKDVTLINQEFLKRCTGRLTLNCKSLKHDMVAESCHTEITLGESVETIAQGTFAELSNLHTFKGRYASEDGRCLISNNNLLAIAPAGLTEFNIPVGVTSIGESTFSGCNNLTKITIPDSVAEIGWRAFSGCTSLATITIPNGAKELGNATFSGCSNLAEVNIPNSVTTIGALLFENCTSLTSVTLPESVTTFEEDIFAGCSALTTIYCLAPEPPTFKELKLSENVIIYVPKEAAKTYKQHPLWSVYKKQIKAIK